MGLIPWISQNARRLILTRTHDLSENHDFFKMKTTEAACMVAIAQDEQIQPTNFVNWVIMKLIFSPRFVFYRDPTAFFPSHFKLSIDLIYYPALFGLDFEEDCLE